MLILGTTAFIIHDSGSENKQVSSASVKSNGRIGEATTSSFEALEKAVVATKTIPVPSITEQLFSDLKNIFGKDVELLIN